MRFPALHFAAGLGTRMAPLTDSRPKPLIEVAGRSLLDHALALTDHPQIGRRVVNAHYRAPMIRAHLAGRDIAISDEAELLDTGGGLRRALPLLGTGPVVTLNTDAVWRGPDPVGALLDGGAPVGARLLLVPAARAVAYAGRGDFDLDAHGRLRRGGPYVYTGLQVMSPDRLTTIPEDIFSLNRLWDLLIADGTLEGRVWDGHWCDVGRPTAIPLAEAMLEAADV